MYTFFEPELPCDSLGGGGIIRANKVSSDGLKSPPGSSVGERHGHNSLKRGTKSTSNNQAHPLSGHNPAEKRTNSTASGSGSGRRSSAAEKISWNVLDLKGDNYFSCSVGRTRTNARYLLASSDEVVSFFKELADASSSS